MLVFLGAPQEPMKMKLTKILIFCYEVPLPYNYAPAKSKRSLPATFVFCYLKNTPKILWSPYGTVFLKSVVIVVSMYTIIIEYSRLELAI